MLLTLTGLIGFIVFPLMPPRLLTLCDNHYGGCDKNFTFVDSLDVFKGPLNWDSKVLNGRSNYYAAMPSLHFGWSMWCFYSLYPLCLNKIFPIMIIAFHPLFTLFVIIVTANHYILDSIMGFVAFLIGEVLGFLLTKVFTFGRGTESGGLDKKTAAVVAITVLLVLTDFIKF